MVRIGEGCAPGTADPADTDGDGYDADADCDDGNAAVRPGAPELCDGFDNDCDGAIDEDGRVDWHPDGDGDGYGDPTRLTQACAAPDGYVGNDDDCDDDNDAVHPHGTERCDGRDDDCDGEVDEDAVDATTWTQDDDGDGYGLPDGDTAEGCTAPDGYGATNDDCDDGDPSIHPDASEVCDGIDQDCDDEVDEDAVDAPRWPAAPISMATPCSTWWSGPSPRMPVGPTPARCTSCSARPTDLPSAGTPSLAQIRRRFMPNLPPHRRDHLVVGLVAALVLGAVFGPALPALASGFLGIEEVDYYGTLWFYWFVGHNLAQGLGPLSTDLFFWPFGKDIFLHTGANVLDAYLALPLRWVFGPVLGFNLFLLLGVAFDGWAFSRLAREFTEDRVAIGVSSVLFAATPYSLYELAEGRPTQAILGLLPLFLVQVWRAAARPGWRAPLLGGVLLAVMGYQYWYYAFFSGIVSLFLGAWRIVRPPEETGGRGAVLGRLAVVGLLGLTLTAPLALPLYLAARAGGDSLPGLLDLSKWTLSSLGTPTTAEGHDIALLTWQPLLRQTGFFMVSGEGDAMLLGHQRVTSWVTLALVVAWIVRPGRLPRGAWLAMAAGAAALALGPLLVMGSHYVVNPVYLVLAHALDFLRRLWWPARAYAWLAVLFGLSGTMALAWVGRKGWRLQAAASLVVGVAWAGDLQVSGLLPIPTWDAAVPAAWRCLAQGPEGALIELPYGWTQAHLYYQTVHQRPILGGMLENNPVFHPPEATALRTDNGWLATVLAAPLDGADPHPWSEPDRDAIQESGFQYVVLQKGALSLHKSSHSMSETIERTRNRRVRRTLVDLLGEPVYEDARGAIFSPFGAAAPCDPGALTADEEVPAHRPETRTSSVRDLPHRTIQPLSNVP